MIDRLNVGGPTHHVTLLARGLGARGYETVLTKGQVAQGEVEMEDVVRQAGVQPQEIEGLGRAISPLQDVQAFWGLYRLMRRFRPQVVHTHKAKAGVLGRLAARLAGVPVVVHTFHGHVFRGYFSRWKSGLIVLVERLLAQCTDAVVAVSRPLRQDLLSFRIARPPRLKAIPLGLRLEPFLACRHTDGGFRAELGFEPCAPLVGMLPRLVPIKGVDVFLRAAQQVVQEMPEVRFVVVGDGELRGGLEALARRLGLEAQVCFTGFRRDTDRIYAALDLVALSSFNEGLPVSLIEALASGCYVVATRVGGVSDLVVSERVGLTVAPGDAGALAGAMLQALRGRRRVPLEERKRVGERYGIDRLMEDVDRLYRLLLEGKQSTGNAPGVCWERTKA